MEKTMRKTILLGLGLALSMAGVAAAQQPDKGGMRRERAGDERGPGMRGRGGPDGLLLKGITLTDGQRAQIAQLRKTQRAETAAEREQRRGQLEQVRAARQKGDTAAVRQMVERHRAEQRQDRAQHLAAIRSLLTAEQRVQFDKNVAELEQRMATRGDRMVGGKPDGPGQRGPGGKAGQRGPGRAG
jgi:Spy/CpxP family protein refolding chaperone